MRHHRAALVLAAVLAAGCQKSETDHAPPYTEHVTLPPDGSGGGSGDATAGSGGWAQLPSRWQPTARAYHTAVWTGDRMVVFGGENKSGAPLGDGATYVLADDAWQPLALNNAPQPRTGHTAVWTAGGMVVWGGTIREPLTGVAAVTDTGAVYDPVGSHWTATPALGAPAARTGHTAVSTGSEMIVWGGDGGGHLGTGAVFDALAGTWHAMSTTGAPSARSGHTAVWTGSEMIVWGGQGQTLEGTGAAYDPAHDTWHPIASQGAPSPRKGHTAVWVDGKMIVYGGVGLDGTKSVYFAAGGVYDPATDSWSPMSEDHAPVGRVGHAAVAFGTRMMVYGGNDDKQVFSSGGLYDPATDTWKPIGPRANDTRTGFAAVSTGTAFIDWGGYASDYGGGTAATYLDTGYVYTPAP